CIDKDQAEKLLSDYDSIACDSFTERNSSLEESYFKQLLKQGAPTTVQVAKTMRCRIHDAESQAKKPSSYYMRILKEAHRRSVEELAVALGVSEDDVEARIAQTFEGFGQN
ncbi:MAG: AsnC family protein, partial [Collinsella bouchesdurhonensis]|nr:AsnC family protein [Collinsella bouchesdurhonensis]